MTAPAAPLPHQDRSALHDDFLGWLRFANAGMLDDGNIIAMDYALRHLPTTGAIVEIGSFCGLSTNVLTHLMRRNSHPGRPLFTCDPWLFEGADQPDVPMGDGGITFGDYRELVKQSFIRNVRAFSRHSLPHTLEMLSEPFFEKWAEADTVIDVFDRPARLGGPIAFGYIDGDHSYDQARKDFLGVDRHLVPGGFILFDDSADGTPWEVCQLVQELLDEPAYQLIDRFPNYLFRKKST